MLFHFILFSWHVIVMESAAVTDKFLPALMLKSFALVMEIWSPLFTVTLPPLVTCTALSVIISTPLFSFIFMLVFLNYSRHLSEFCRFTKIPGASKITHFKQDFLQDLQLMFDKMVDVTEPISKKIDNNLASMVILIPLALNHE